jgi:hypothetical protein
MCSESIFQIHDIFLFDIDEIKILTTLIFHWIIPPHQPNNSNNTESIASQFKNLQKQSIIMKVYYNAIRTFLNLPSK